MSNINLLSATNTACLGCGQIMAARTVINALAPNVIVANATGCLEITTTNYPNSAWGAPWIHSLFANPASVASGIFAALKRKGKQKDIKVLVQAGDGSTFDIGFGALSGLWNRGEPIIYVVYDNEIYANTGAQASAATPRLAHTTTTPALNSTAGFDEHKKDMIAIALAHKLPYVAQTTNGHLDDLAAKVKQAALADGPSYIQVLCSCLPGWGFNANEAVSLPRLAADTGLYPLLEYVDGKPTSNWKIPKPQIPVAEYLKTQKRFKHLFESEDGLTSLQKIQNLADTNIEKYSL